MKYGSLIPSTRLADELCKVSGGELSLSSEAVRKWLRGKSVPRGLALVALDDLLGDYFLNKRKLSKPGSALFASLEGMNTQDLIDVQRAIAAQLENSYIQATTEDKKTISKDGGK